MYTTTIIDYDTSNPSTVPMAFFAFIDAYRSQHRHPTLAVLGSRLTEVRDESGGRSVRSSALDVHTCPREPTAHQIHVHPVPRLPAPL